MVPRVNRGFHTEGSFVASLLTPSGKSYGAYSRQTAVGWRYMDKFVQLSFVIPPIDAERFA